MGTQAGGQTDKDRDVEIVGDLCSKSVRPKLPTRKKTETRQDWRKITL